MRSCVWKEEAVVYFESIILLPAGEYLKKSRSFSAIIR
jgi:hypothetical protein